MTDILKTNTLVTLKKICKFLHIKNYSGLRKNELIIAINKYHAMIKLQRWARRILSKNEECPISCEPIRYPCYAYKTANNVLIYYNLEALRSFLIKTGDFRDPNTRAEYTEKQLLEIDAIYKYSTGGINQSNEDYFKSVLKASKSTRFYEKLKEHEEEKLIFERLLDTICDEIITFINENQNDNFFILNALYLHEYQIQFRRLLNRSKENAEYVINKNIDNFSQILTKEKNYNKKQHESCGHVIAYLFQLREELYLD